MIRWLKNGIGIYEMQQKYFFLSPLISFSSLQYVLFSLVAKWSFLCVTLLQEIQSQSDNYRSSSSSTSSPTRRVPLSNFFYLHKPGSLRQLISFKDSPEWEDTDVDVRVEEGGDRDTINIAITPASSSL